jgi:hypothetical protein
MENVNQKSINAYREAADWLEQHPELPRIYPGNIGVFARGEDQKAEAAIVAKAMGKSRKVYTESSLHLGKKFGEHCTITYLADRDKVCERVKVGTRVEPAQTLSAREEQFVPEHEVELFEWKCSPLLEPEEESAVTAA